MTTQVKTEEGNTRHTEKSRDMFQVLGVELSSELVFCTVCDVLHLYFLFFFIVSFASMFKLFLTCNHLRLIMNCCERFHGTT